MKIVSEFHDFYDIALAYGQDESLRYVRTRDAKEDRPPVPHVKFPWSGAFICRQYIIGFCGKLYASLYLTRFDEDIAYRKNFYTPGEITLTRIADIRRHQAKTGEPKGEFVLSLDDMDKWVEKNLKKDYIKEYYEAVKKGKWWKRTQKPLRNQFEEFFEALGQPAPAAVQDVFQKYRVPIFLLDYENYKNVDGKSLPHPLILNPCLKDCEFHRRLDPYSAYQEVAMFVTNIAQPEPHVPVPSDKDMVEIKGFDKKWSFRKEPTKKK